MRSLLVLSFLLLIAAASFAAEKKVGNGVFDINALETELMGIQNRGGLPGGLRFSSIDAVLDALEEAKRLYATNKIEAAIRALSRAEKEIIRLQIDHNTFKGFRSDEKEVEVLKLKLSEKIKKHKDFLSQKIPHKKLFAGFDRALNALETDLLAIQIRSSIPEGIRFNSISTVLDALKEAKEVLLLKPVQIKAVISALDKAKTELMKLQVEENCSEDFKFNEVENLKLRLSRIINVLIEISSRELAKIKATIKDI